MISDLFERLPFFSLLILLSSCGNNIVFEKKIILPSDKWYYQDTLAYQWEIDDTSGEHQMLMLVEHNTGYVYQNMYLKIDTHFPGDSVNQQILSVDLADRTGEWFGDCIGSGCEVEFILQERVLFAQTGLYRIELQQYMRINPVTDIRSIALRLLRTGSRAEL